MSDQSTRLTISLPPEVHKDGKKKAKKRGFRNSFSAYIAKLIEDDKNAIANEAPASGK